MAKGHAFLDVLDGVVDGALGNAHGTGGHDGAAGVQRFHRHLEALAAFGADAVGFGDEGFVEEQRAGRHAARAHLGLFLPYGEALGAFFHDEHVDAQLGAVFGQGLGGHQHEIGDVGVRTPDFRAVHDVAAGHLAGSGFDAGHIGTALRFGQRQGAAQFAAGQARQQALLLFFGAARQNGAKRGPLHHQQVAGVVADTAKLFHGNARGQQAVGATVLFGEGQREQAEFLQEFVHVVRVFSGAVDLVGARGHFFAGHTADQVLDAFLVFVQFVAHATSPWFN